MPANPLDWTGPEFLALYSVLLLVMGALALALRWLVRGPGGLAPPGTTLTAGDLAYLVGGPSRVVDAAIVQMYAQGLLATKAGRLAAAPAAGGRKRSEIESRIAETAGTGNTATNIRSLANERAARLGPALVDLGLAPPGNGLAARLVCVLPMLVVTLLGALKIAVGVSREKPVAYLVVLTVVAFIGMLLCLLPIYRTRRGSAVVAQARERNAALRHVASKHGEAVAPGDLAFAFALFGAGSLGASAFADLRTALQPQTASSSLSDGGGSSCGSGCGGGGGCGGCS